MTHIPCGLCGKEAAYYVEPDESDEYGDMNLCEAHFIAHVAPRPVVSDDAYLAYLHDAIPGGFQFVEPDGTVVYDSSSVTPVTVSVVWADNVFDTAIAAMNDLHDWFATTGQQPGAPQAVTAMADSIRLAANDVANLRQAWNDYLAHVSKASAHRLTQDEKDAINANLRGL